MPTVSPGPVTRSSQSSQQTVDTNRTYVYVVTSLWVDLAKVSCYSRLNNIVFTCAFMLLDRNDRIACNGKRNYSI